MTHKIRDTRHKVTIHEIVAKAAGYEEPPLSYYQALEWPPVNEHNDTTLDDLQRWIEEVAADLEKERQYATPDAEKIATLEADLQERSEQFSRALRIHAALSIEAEHLTTGSTTPGTSKLELVSADHGPKHATFTTYSAYAWLKSQFGVDIPEWAPHDSSESQVTGPSIDSKPRRWEDLELRFYKGNTVKFFSEGKVIISVDYTDSLLFNKTKKELSQKGEILLDLATFNAVTLPKKELRRRKNLQSCVTKISTWLRQTTGIKTAPFITQEDSYTPRFRVADKRYDAQNRFEDGRYSSKTDAGTDDDRLKEMIEEQARDLEDERTNSIAVRSDEHDEE